MLLSKEHLWSPEKRIDFLDSIWQAKNERLADGSKRYQIPYLYTLVHWEFYNGHLYSEEVQQFLAWLTENERHSLKKQMISNHYVMFMGDESAYKKVVYAITLTLDASEDKHNLEEAKRLKAIVEEAPDNIDAKDLLPDAMALLYNVAEEFGLTLTRLDDGKIIFIDENELEEDV